MINEKTQIWIIYCHVARYRANRSHSRSVHLHTLYAASNENAITSEELHEVLTSAMVSRTDQFQFTYKGKVKVLKATLQEAIEKAMRSDSYIQYTLKSYAYHYKGTNASAEVSIEFKYRESLEQTAYVNSRVDQILTDIIKPGMNDHEKVEAIHNYVVLNLAYDEAMQNIQLTMDLRREARCVKATRFLLIGCLPKQALRIELSKGRRVVSCTLGTCCSWMESGITWTRPGTIQRRINPAKSVITTIC